MNYIRNEKLHRLLRIYFSLRRRKMKTVDIAKCLGVTERTVQRYLNDLVDSGIVIRQIQSKRYGLFYKIDPDSNKVNLL